MKTRQLNSPVNEIFSSCQGEGRYAGHPALFIRFTGCTRKCRFCDTSYHVIGQLPVADVEKAIRKWNSKKHGVVVFTGGEPLMRFDLINQLITTSEYEGKWHIETNGDLIANGKILLPELVAMFDYIAISPKEESVAKKIWDLVQQQNTNKIDIKVVTDLETIGRDMLQYATMLMPLTTHDLKLNKEIKQKVWKYCSEKGFIYSPRLHAEVFDLGKRRV